jgi:glucose 1-dehydrogenase
VTGAASGIGLATLKRLAREGASVCLNYYSERDRDGAEEVVSDIVVAGGKGIAVQADVGVEADVQRLVARAAEAFGGLDLLVNNAGVERRFDVLDMTLAEWERVLRTNLTGSFLCLREAARVMAGGAGGVIVNMSSVHEFIPWPGFAHYCASKSGVRLLMQTAAKELAGKGIRVVNIAPGAILTPINQFVLDDPQATKALVGEIPLGRMGSPDEIASAVVWVASGEAGYVTGTTIVVDGGISLYPRFL